MLLAAFALAAPPPPIVGGQPAPGRTEVVLLLLSDAQGQPQGVCTGTQVSPTHVLTAAHCVDDSVGPAPAAIFVIRAPDLDSATTDDTVAAAGWVAHPEADAESGAHDLAVLTLEAPTSPPTVALDATGLGDAHLGVPLTLVGYGATADADPNDNPTRRALEVPLYELDAALLYTWAPDDGNACFGDSGGPVFRVRDDGRTALVGVISYVSGCDGGGMGAPRVAVDLDWIAAHADVEVLAAEAAPEPDTGDTGEAPEGCGCGTAGAGALPAGAVAAAWGARRRQRPRR